MGGEGRVGGYSVSLQSQNKSILWDQCLGLCEVLMGVCTFLFQTNHMCIHLVITCGHPDSELLWSRVDFRSRRTPLM